MIKYTESARKQTLALHKDVRLLQFHANGTDDYWFHPHRRTQRGRAFIFHHLPYPACLVFLLVQTPNGDRNVSTDVITNMLPVFRCAHSTKQKKKKKKRGKEDVHETCPKETSKGQWSTTKCISSICCIQQDVANASFSLPIRGEQEKGCSRGKSLEMFIML